MGESLSFPCSGLVSAEEKAPAGRLSVFSTSLILLISLFPTSSQPFEEKMSNNN